MRQSGRCADKSRRIPPRLDLCAATRQGYTGAGVALELAVLDYRLESISVTRIVRLLHYLEEHDGQAPEDGLCCRSCGHPVVHHSQAIEVAGSHAHHCRNPEDEYFHIGCFRGAKGLRLVGEPSGAWSWFAGFRWQVAVCAHCGVQLGWHFTGGEAFAGLILDRLADCQPDQQT